ncbi:MAG: drug/metabolite transporter (DMT)-like permease [Parasphingorhabdus sp.]|jgi:drug/metabolite transporter (DMT)-like permease
MKKHVVITSNQPLRGIAYMLASLLGMAILTIIVKLVSDKEALAEILFFRFAGSLIPLLFILQRAGGLSVLRTQQPLQHALRSVFGLSGIACYFYAIGSIPLADAITLSYTAPIFVVLLSLPILGEKITRVKLFAVTGGFAGALLIVRPEGQDLSLGTLIAIAGAILGALVSIWLRKLSLREHAATIAMFYNSSSAVICLIWLISTDWQLEFNFNLVLMITIGLVAGCQQYLMTRAFSFAEAGFLVQFDYVILIFAAIAGWFIWSEIPTWQTITGGIIITASGLLIAKYSNHANPKS